MLNKSNTNGKHLTEFDRSFIESALSNTLALNEIAEQLGKDPRTISKEIKRNRLAKKSSSSFKGGCVNRKKCSKKNVCSNSCNNICKSCININCMRVCVEFKSKECNKTTKYPHVCNGCEIKLTCKLDKYIYNARHAEVDYRDRLITSRKGINMTPSELEALDDLVSPLILKGQPIIHVYNNHKDEIGCSLRTLYNLIDKGFLSIRNIDLRRKVSYKVRKSTAKAHLKTQHRVGRSYDEFVDYISRNPDVDVIEMDTVIGKIGGQALLTIYFRSCKVMALKLLERKSQEHVLNAINQIYDAIGLETFKSSFPVILLDNGTEFTDVDCIEFDKDGNKRTQVFYCDPYSSYQKGQIEKNHEYIRYVLPKGRSFEDLNQEKVNRLANHINSVWRESLNGNTPFKLGNLLLNHKLMEALSFKEVTADEVHLKEELIDPTYVKKTLLDAIFE